jgi:transcriptional regulator with GAF, ATPase, and Fis domain
MQEFEALEKDETLKRKVFKEAGIDDRLLTRNGLALLGMVGRLASAELHVKKLLDLALGMALDATGAERGFIILVDEEGNYKHLSAHDIKDEEITSPDFRTSHTMVREVMKTGKSKLVLDTEQDEKLRDAKSIVDLGLRSVLCTPIIQEDAVIGVVYLDTTSLEHAFKESDLALMQAFTQRISPMIARAVEHERQEIRLKSLEEEVRTRYAYSNIVGKSKPMREMFRIMDSVTDTDFTVYIYGETGTGKELVAKALHYNSGRKERNDRVPARQRALRAREGGVHRSKRRQGRACRSGRRRNTFPRRNRLDAD